MPIFFVPRVVRNFGLLDRRIKPIAMGSHQCLLRIQKRDSTSPGAACLKTFKSSDGDLVQRDVPLPFSVLLSSNSKDSSLQIYV